ncbi:MAG: biopolymer transporter ExbD [Myxococcales bacterium]|nr:biopolymer transporter ExbD [Myxococcales bacterium]USN51531.1 MAG: biopolymer transporter ExbD [Myxococcales bacterium]
MGLLSSDQEGDLFADINVTPMVDVVLVLLIIFMVTAPFMIETIGVNLPKGEGADAQGLTTPLTISIDKDENISIAKQMFSLEMLKEFLRDNPRVKDGEPVYVEADQNIRHKTLMEVMSTAYVAGASKINIIMEKP